MFIYPFIKILNTIQAFPHKQYSRALKTPTIGILHLNAGYQEKRKYVMYLTFTKQAHETKTGKGYREFNPDLPLRIIRGGSRIGLGREMEECEAARRYLPRWRSRYFTTRPLSPPPTISSMTADSPKLRVINQGITRILMLGLALAEVSEAMISDDWLLESLLSVGNFSLIWSNHLYRRHWQSCNTERTSDLLFTLICSSDCSTLH